jgi:hypothetical protein
MNKSKMNYWVDVVTGLAFLLSATSGIVFLLPVSQTFVLGISYALWNQVHTWGSLLMIGGVFTHLVMHWKWMVAMTKSYVRSLVGFTPADGAAQATGMGRRKFLQLAGLGAIMLGIGAAGYKVLSGDQPGDENLVDLDSQVDAGAEPVLAAAETENQSQMEMGAVSEGTSENEVSLPRRRPEFNGAPSSSTSNAAVACPRGVTYDLYPGRCHHYVDRNGDGYCDYSIPEEEEGGA